MTESDSNKLLIDHELVERALVDAPDWITAEMIERTIRVWQPYYSEPITPQDAVEMIVTFRGLIDVISKS